MKTKKLIASVLGAAAIATSGQAAAVSVGLELMLLVDVSGSVDNTEYTLQRQGYIDAFNSAAVQNAITGSVGGAIAVTYIEWSGNAQQSVRVGWTLINSIASAQAFATAIGNTTRAFSGNTAIQDAIGKEYVLFGTEVGGNSNGFESLRQVIDVSGDGADNNSTTFCAAGCGRNAAIAAGVDAINGLPILGEGGLLTYYQTNVQGGGGAFTTPVNSFDDFGAAIQSKLIREVTQVPEPGTMLLIGTGLLGFGFARRRKV